MKILFIGEIGAIGGASTAIEELANASISLKHSVSLLIGLDRNGTESSSKNLNKAVKLFRYKVNFNGNINVFFTLALGLFNGLTKIQNEINPDLIILNYSFSAGLVCIHPLFWKKRKIFLFHGDEPRIMWSLIPKPKKQPVLGWIKRVLFSGIPIALVYIGMAIGLRLSTLIFVFSKYMKKNFPIKNQRIQKKLRITSLGIDSQKFVTSKNVTVLRCKLNISPNTVIFLCTSRFEYRKGIDMLIESFYLAQKKISNSLLILATSADAHSIKSSYFQDVRHSISTRKLQDKVKILYNLSREELIPYYQAADLYVLPSRSLESFGLVVLESMACGLPVVCYRYGGAPQEVVSKISKKFIFDTYSPEVLSQYMVKHIHAKKIFKNKLIQTAKKYNWTRSINDILKKTENTY